MLPFRLDRGDRLDPGDGALHVLAVGAHADDVEIGAGGTLLELDRTVGALTVEIVVLTGGAERATEACRAPELFLPGRQVAVRTGGLRDGYLPQQWAAAKELLAEVARGRVPDVVLAPSRGDAHQDHRTVAELVTTVWRDQLVLEYEIPKWDGDLARPWLYVPLSEEVVREKAERLRKAFPSQCGHDWFDDEVFLGLARLRGMECRSRYAEAFATSKATLRW